ncbi:MAG: hypothetical protein ABIJ00_02505 [Candidatus Eisenbacteria bacterium]
MRIPASGSLSRAATCKASQVLGQAAGRSIIRNQIGMILFAKLCLNTGEEGFAPGWVH